VCVCNILHPLSHVLEGGTTLSNAVGAILLPWESSGHSGKCSVNAGAIWVLCSWSLPDWENTEAKECRDFTCIEAVINQKFHDVSPNAQDADTPSVCYRGDVLGLRTILLRVWVCSCKSLDRCPVGQSKRPFLCSGRSQFRIACGNKS